VFLPAYDFHALCGTGEKAGLAQQVVDKVLTWCLKLTWQRLCEHLLLVRLTIDSCIGHAGVLGA